MVKTTATTATSFFLTVSGFFSHPVLGHQCLAVAFVLFHGRKGKNNPVRNASMFGLLVSFWTGAKCPHTFGKGPNDHLGRCSLVLFHFPFQFATLPTKKKGKGDYAHHDDYHHNRKA